MPDNFEWAILLGGVVGSTAYGLARPGSDVDRMAFAAAPTVAFHGLHPPIGKAASRVSTDPDLTVHEAGKAVALLMKCNPSLVELLWLDSHETRTPLGEELIGLRRSLLSARGVRDAYLGYAVSQFEKLRSRGRSFSSDTRLRTAKHARHLLRLIRQGQELYVTGGLQVRVPDPDRYFEFAERIVTDPEKGLEVAETTLATTRLALDSRPSALPDRPDEAAAEAWLRRVRAHHYDREAADA